LPQGNHTVTLQPGESLQGWDFGNRRIFFGPRGITGTLFEDLDQDLVFDGEEPVLPGWSVMLFNAEEETPLITHSALHSKDAVGPGGGIGEA